MMSSNSPAAAGPKRPSPRQLPCGQLGITFPDMTKLLKEAFARASRLPDAEQDALAAILLDEIEDEARWHAAFRKSQTKLAKLGAEALAELRAGRAKPMRFGRPK